MTTEEMKDKLRNYCHKYENCYNGCIFKCDCEWCRTDDDSVITKEYRMAFPSPTAEEPHIKDSGERRQFYDADGNPMAVRDIQEGKGRCDLMPLGVVGEYLSNIVIKYIGEFQNTGDIAHLHYALANIEWGEPYSIILEVAKHFEDGAKKYGEYNWQKGIPAHCYIDSAVRHYLKWLRGDKDEPHDRAFIWNILCCIWTCIHKPELNDYGKKEV